MPFSTRNARYLRISADTILPLYIYLDEKHVEWMSDYVLQRVLADLKPNIGPKLRIESNIFGNTNTKKGTFEVCTGDTYKFAYFFRKNESHAVLIKNRTFIPAPNALPAEAPLTDDRGPSRKKRKRETTDISRKKVCQNSCRSSQVGSASENDDDARTAHFEQGEHIASEGTKVVGTSKSNHKKTFARGHTDVGTLEVNDIEITSPEPGVDNNCMSANDIETSCQSSRLGDLEVPQHLLSQEPQSQISDALDVDSDEEKPKMALRVSYQGFNICDRCLCVVIEPWPPVRNASRGPSRALSLTARNTIMTNIPPMDERTQIPISSRERTPLFLPDVDSRRSLTPAPLPARIMPLVPLFDEVAERQDVAQDYGGGIMAFSQILESMSDKRAGDADEDEDEGDVFLGDADERKGGT